MKTHFLTSIRSRQTSW